MRLGNTLLWDTNGDNQAEISWISIKSVTRLLHHLTAGRGGHNTCPPPTTHCTVPAHQYSAFSCHSSYVGCFSCFIDSDSELDQQDEVGHRPAHQRGERLLLHREEAGGGEGSESVQLEAEVQRVHRAPAFPAGGIKLISQLCESQTFGQPRLLS